METKYPALAMPYLTAREAEDRPFLRNSVVYEPPCKLFLKILDGMLTESRYT